MKLLESSRTITARELRQILFGLDNQQLTVEELRRKLFDAPQDTEIEIGTDSLRKMGIPEKKGSHDRKRKKRSTKDSEPSGSYETLSDSDRRRLALWRLV